MVNRRLKQSDLLQSPSNSQRSWQQAADDKATEARKAVGDASQSAKDSAHSVYQNASEAVAATYHDVKDSAVATVTDLEEGAKSAIEKLKDRLDTSMEPTNDAEAMKSVGLVPSNTEVRLNFWQSCKHRNNDTKNSITLSLAQWRFTSWMSSHKHS